MGCSNNCRGSSVWRIEPFYSVDAPELPALLERYERPLVRYAQSILGDLEAARDVVQETFIRYVRHEVGLAPAAGADSEGRSVESWLFTVTRNLSIDHQRKQSRIIYMPQTEDRTADEPAPGAALEARESGDALFALLEQLSENQRDVIRLKFQNDLSYKEIAEVTQLSVTNVGFLLHTGLKKLRTLLEAQPHADWPQPLRQTV